MKNKNKIILSILGLLIFSGVSNSTTRVVKANDSSPVISSSEVVNSNSTSTIEITNSSTNETILTEDQLEEIVLKISNKLLGEELTDKLFGLFGFGIIAILLVYVIFQVNERMKNKKVGDTLVSSTKEAFDNIKENVKNLKEEVNTYKETIKCLQKEYTELVNNNNNIVKELTELSIKIHDDYTKVIKSLNNYQKFDKKLNTILEIEKEYTKNPINVVHGISEKVNSLIEEVNLDEKD